MESASPHYLPEDYENADGTVLTSFRVAEAVPAIEHQLRLNTSALLILSDEEVEGTIVHFSAAWAEDTRSRSSRRKLKLRSAALRNSFSRVVQLHRSRLERPLARLYL